MRVLGIPEWLKLIGTNQLVVYIDDGNKLRGRVRILKGNAEALKMGSKEI
jgi:uncharacterized membrane protein YcfT